MTAIAIPAVSRLRRLRTPLLAGATAGLATVFVASVNPNNPGHYPPCPLKWTTGLDCPACGGLRTVFSLSHGDFAAAIDHNLLAVVALPALVVWWALIVYRGWTGTDRTVTPESARRTRIVTIAIIAVTIGFTIARNVPMVPLLNSALS